MGYAPILRLAETVLCKQKEKILKKNIIYNTITIFIAIVWLANGLFCKVLNFVPRHEQIAARILGETHSRTLIILIGISEIVMAIWVLSKFKPKINAITQIMVVGAMNVLEFILVPDLLLWGRLNAFFALTFIGLIYYNEFILKNKINQRTIN